MTHAKDFDAWHIKKKELHKRKGAPFFHQREVWWCALGANVGFEQDGTGRNFDRPVVVLKGFSKESLVVVPLVGRAKPDSRFYYLVGQIDGREATAVLSQVRLVDSKRLIRKIDTLSEKNFMELQEKMKRLLF